MTAEEMRAGSGGAPPDTSGPWTIIRAKTEGVTEVEAVLKWGDPAKILTRKRKGHVLAKWIYRKRDEDGLPRVQRLCAGIERNCCGGSAV